VLLTFQNKKDDTSATCLEQYGYYLKVNTICSPTNIEVLWGMYRLKIIYGTNPGEYHTYLELPNWDLVPHHANPAGAVHAPTHVMPALAGSSSRATEPLDQQYVWVGPPTINETTRAKNNSRKTFVS
jgi:hypothetical protein